MCNYFDDKVGFVENVMKAFGELFIDETKKGIKLQTSEYKKQGNHIIVDQGKNPIAGYTDREKGLFEDVPVIIFGDHTRVIKYVDQPFFLGADGVKILRSKDKNSNYKYLYYALRNANIPDTGYNRHFKWLKETKINYPSVARQDEIVKILDKLSAIIDRRKTQLQGLDNLIKARFVEMFGDPKINPRQYPVSELSEYIEFLTSGSRGWAKYCTDDGTEWFITIKNVKDCRISVNNIQSVNAPDNAEAIRTKVQEGDLLISITADLGRTGVVTKEIAEHGAYINQHLTCIRLNKKILDPLYVAYFMESNAGKEQFESKNQSAVKAGLNFNSINSLRIIIPPISIQKEFISFVHQVDKSKVVVQKALDEAQLLFDSLMQKYFG